MENDEAVLEEGKAELTLDPPSYLNIDELLNKDTINISPDENKDHSKFSNCLIEKIIKCQGGDNFNIKNETNVNVDATGNSTMLQDVEQQNEILTSIIPASSSLVLHDDDVSTKKVKKSRSNNPYYGKQKLKSCLKLQITEKHDKNKEKRNVHFNTDIVKEYIEPVDPWRDVRTPTKAEVISFYRNSCKKLRCKLLDKVVKQIQEAPDLSNRAGTLVLRGSRLDTRSCEALETVFRRVQFENLDVENCSLEEEAATSLLEMIEFYNSTCKLNIACNPKIGMRGWQALCRMLRKTPSLTYLDARRTLLTDMTMPTFGRCLKADPHLKILHLEGVFLSGRPLLILTTAMKYNTILEELYLGDNDLSSSDGPPIGAMLTYNTSLQLLDLRNNQMKDIGLAHIGNGLSDQSEQLQGGLCSLIVWNNGLTHEGMSYLCEGLIRTTSLKALNLGQNRIGDLGVQKLKNGLIKNKSLRKLGFLNTKLGSEGAVALAEVLADSLSITRIDIRENHIQVAGLMAFSMALKVNQSMLRLDLDKDIKKEPGMESVMQTVLVDIYNLCHRNKQVARQNMPSFSTSSVPYDQQVSRNSSTSSEIADAIAYDDIFHPESSKQQITPYSPVTSSPIKNQGPVMFPDHFNLEEQSSSEKDQNICNIIPPFEAAAKVRPHSVPSPKESESAQRHSRFSVTKIWDSLGNHAAGVANKIATNVASFDTKLKKRNSKEKIDVISSELMAVLDQTHSPIEEIALMEHFSETDSDIVSHKQNVSSENTTNNASSENIENNASSENTQNNENKELDSNLSSSNISAFDNTIKDTKLCVETVPSEESSFETFAKLSDVNNVIETNNSIDEIKETNTSLENNLFISDDVTCNKILPNVQPSNNVLSVELSLSGASDCDTETFNCVSTSGNYLVEVQSNDTQATPLETQEVQSNDTQATPLETQSNDTSLLCKMQTIDSNISCKMQSTDSGVTSEMHLADTLNTSCETQSSSLSDNIVVSCDAQINSLQEHYHEESSISMLINQSITT